MITWTIFHCVWIVMYDEEEGSFKSNGVNRFWTGLKFPCLAYCHCKCFLSASCPWFQTYCFCFLYYCYCSSVYFLFLYCLVSMIQTATLSCFAVRVWISQPPSCGFLWNDLTSMRLVSVSFGNGENSLVSREGTFRLIVERMVVVFQCQIMIEMFFNNLCNRSGRTISKYGRNLWRRLSLM